MSEKNRLLFFFQFILASNLTQNAVTRVNRSIITDDAQQKKLEVPFGVYTPNNILHMKDQRRKQEILLQILWVNELCNLLATLHIQNSATEKNTEKNRIRYLARVLNVRKITFFARNINHNRNASNSEQYKVIFTLGDREDTHVVSIHTFLHKNLEDIQTASLSLIPDIKIENVLEKSALSTTEARTVENIISGISVISMIVYYFYIALLISGEKKSDNLESKMEIYNYHDYQNLPAVKERLSAEKICECYPQDIADQIIASCDGTTIRAKLSKGDATSYGLSLFLVGPAGCGKTNTIDYMQDRIIQEYYTLAKKSNLEEPEFCLLPLGGDFFSNVHYMGDSKKRIEDFFKFIRSKLHKNPTTVFIITMNEFADALADPQAIHHTRTSSMDTESFRSHLEQLWKDLLQARSESTPYARFHILCTANPVSGKPSDAILRRFEHIELYTTIDRKKILDVFKTHFTKDIKKESEEFKNFKEPDLNDCEGYLVNMVEKQVNLHLDNLLKEIYGTQDDGSDQVEKTYEDSKLDKTHNFAPSYIASIATQLVGRLLSSIDKIKHNNGGQLLTGNLSTFNGKTIDNITLYEIIIAMQDKIDILIRSSVEKAVALNNSEWLNQVKSSKSE